MGFSQVIGSQWFSIETESSVIAKQDLITTNNDFRLGEKTEKEEKALINISEYKSTDKNVNDVVNAISSNNNSTEENQSSKTEAFRPN